MKTRFTDLHARTALGLQLFPSIIENIAGLSASTLSLIGSLPHILGFLTSMSNGSHILALPSKHWWLNC
jgi:hypothetical protein